MMSLRMTVQPPPGMGPPRLLTVHEIPGMGLEENIMLTVRLVGWQLIKKCLEGLELLND
jgi:hypothetical protein